MTAVTTLEAIKDALPVILIAAAIVMLPLVDWRRG